MLKLPVLVAGSAGRVYPKVQKDGIVDGKREVFDEKGMLVEEGNYVLGKMEGKFFQRSPDGKEVVTHYRNNLRNGPHIIYYPPPTHKVKNTKRSR